MKLSQNKNIIKSLLEENELYRNDHERLIEAVWDDVLAKDGLSINHMSARELLGKMTSKKIPKPASIMRARRAIQQEIPRLRGVSHKIRQDKQEKVKAEVQELRLNFRQER